MADRCCTSIHCPWPHLTWRAACSCTIALSKSSTAKAYRPWGESKMKP